MLFYVFIMSLLKWALAFSMLMLIPECIFGYISLFTVNIEMRQLST